MTLVTIREDATEDDSPNARVSFDGQGEFPVTISNPFSEKEEKDLEWYFEEYLKFPFTDQVRFSQAKESIKHYGEALFAQVFQDKVYARYYKAREKGLHSLSFKIIGSPEFIHRFHWEALKDPELPGAFVLDAPMIRSILNPPVTEAAEIEPSPTINILVVTARPDVGKDIGYRTITRPLVESLSSARVPVKIDIVRPGTYEALDSHLKDIRDSHANGYYHIIHFDLHGALLTYGDLIKEKSSDRILFQARYGRDDIPKFDGKKAFLFFESEEPGKADLAEAEEIASLMLRYRVPIAILNACQSGKQSGDTDTILAGKLLEKGVQTALAMSYSITVSAAKAMMEALYNKLFEKNNLSRSICYARSSLYNQKARDAYFNQRIDLEDWVLPVVYQSGDEEPILELRDFSFEEQMKYYGDKASRYQGPKPTYNFVGRDLDILRIEKRLLSESEGKLRNILLIKGMGGAGKTALLHHLAEWWQTTGFVGNVSYFGYDQSAWKLPQIMDDVAKKLFGVKDDMPTSSKEYFQLMQFRLMSDKARKEMLAQMLRSKRHLLILDNLESVTGERLAIMNTLTKEERDAIRGFLYDLLGGKTLVLLGTRGGEDWLIDGDSPPLRKTDVYEMPGLDPEAASTLADYVLERNVSDKETRDLYRKSQDFTRLLNFLKGYPLPIQVVLANLSSQTPAEVIVALKLGDADIDNQKGVSKTESILRCIDYSHSNLSQEAQRLLLCLSPFTGVIFEPTLDNYTKYLKEQPATSGLPFDRWQDVIQEASRWGLMTQHELPGFISLQPVLPYFLKNRLNQESDDLKRSIETAFRQHYDDLSCTFWSLLSSDILDEHKAGQAIIRIEYENIASALDLSLNAQASILKPFVALSGYLNANHDYQRGLEISQMVQAQLERYSQDELSGPIGIELAAVNENIVNCQFMLRRHEDAQKSCEDTLQISLGTKYFATGYVRKMYAPIYIWMGMLAQGQRQWTQAEQYYEKALEIEIEFNDKHSQVSIYHNLGMVEQEQRLWKQAKKYYEKALEIEIEFDDQYNLAKTYHQMGSLAQDQKQWAQAEQHYDEALKIKIELKDRYSQAVTYHQKGWAAQEQNQWDMAEHNYKNALEIYIEFNDLYPQAKTYHNLGMVAQERGEWIQAKKYYDKSLEIKIEFNDRYSQAKTYNGLGTLAQGQKQWQQAEKYYENALNIFIEFKDLHAMSLMYNNLGAVAQDQKQWLQSKDCYLKGLDIIIGFDDKNNLKMIMDNLTKLWKASGDSTLIDAIASILKSDPEDIETLFNGLVGWQLDTDTQCLKQMGSYSNPSMKLLMQSLRFG